jgi:hypothetical protein
MLNLQKLFGKGGVMGRKRFSAEQIIVKLSNTLGAKAKQMNNKEIMRFFSSIPKVSLKRTKKGN